jgi:predicted MFS family arabinose efflux permease
MTAFGLAGLIMPWISGRIRDVTGSLDYSYALIIGMMGVAAILALASQYLNSRQPRLG